MNIDIAQIKHIVISTSETELLPRFNTVTRQYKSDGSIVTEADLAMQTALELALAEAYPDIAFLSEEMETMQQQNLAQSDTPFWCLDPVDGTSNFAAGIPYFCVSLALIQDGEIEFGVVYDPIRQECFFAQRGQGAYLNDMPLRIPETAQMTPDNAIAFVDFKRLSTHLSTQLIIHRPYSSQRNLGSVALELCWIAIGRGQLYLHGRQQLWDYAAALCILNEVGLPIITLDGDELFDGSLTPKSAITASHPDLFDYWRHYLQHFISASHD
tara:strand:- start:105 stop:914 length:810 start_codon:yes stop_codon:yes gene_type:complete